MRYISTRGQAPPVSFVDAVLAGMAPDGGLYVPESWPALQTVGAPEPGDRYRGTVAQTLNLMGDPDLAPLASEQLASVAYGAQWPPAIAPVVREEAGRATLELFHGPSLSFKDVAMQLIAPLYVHALARDNRRLTVLCATSGDTGGAAAEALKTCDRIDLFILLPKGRVSDVQRRFMTSSGASNVHALEVDGDFDDCQRIVKRLFEDRDFSTRAALSGVNSINWARILAQSVYYRVTADGIGEKAAVSFVVPTGNFGNAYSAYAAKRMGARIGRICLATNANDILVRALTTGRYQRAAQSTATLSPAMDIQVASNFERILFEALDRDGEQVSRLYEEFVRTGGFDIPQRAMDFLSADFMARAVTDTETEETIRMEYDYAGRVLDPHTAVARLARNYLPKDVLLADQVVTVATADPVKFAETVERACSGEDEEAIHLELPSKCADLFQRSEKFDSLPADAEAVKQYIRERSRAWS